MTTIFVLMLKKSSYVVNNESLEYIGDRILYVISMMNTYDRSKTMFSPEGFYIGPTANEFSKKGVSQMKNSQLCRIMNMKRLRFLKNLTVAAGKPDSPEAKFWADLYESILGAIGIDCNFDMNVLLNSYIASQTLVQRHGLLSYIKSKQDLDRKINFHRSKRN